MAIFGVFLQHDVKYYIVRETRYFLTFKGDAHERSK